jgi:hypothetical protein
MSAFARTVAADGQIFEDFVPPKLLLEFWYLLEKSHFCSTGERCVPEKKYLPDPNSSGPISRGIIIKWMQRYVETLALTFSQRSFFTTSEDTLGLHQPWQSPEIW